MNEITLNKLRWGYRSSRKRWLFQRLLLLVVLCSSALLHAQTATPWVETFGMTTTIPADWENSNFANVSNTVSNINNANVAPASGSYIYKNIYGTGTSSTGSFTIKNIGPILTGDKFSFIYKTVNYATGDFNAPGVGSGNFTVEISTDNGVTFTNVATVANGASADWIFYQYDLVNYVGQNAKIKITGNLDTSSDADYYLAFDNFAIDSGLCSFPIAPTNGASTLNSVSIVFPGDLTFNYQIEYGEYGFVQGQGDLSDVSTGSTLVLSGLTPSTTYQFYARKVCGAQLNSAWVGPFTASTLCAPFLNDFLQNFDSTPTGTSSNQTIPICWSFIDGGDGYGYVTTGGVISTPNRYYLYNSGDTTNPYILVGPETDDLGNGTKQLRFYAYSGTAGTELLVGTMSSPTSAETFSALITIELATGYNEYVVPLPAGTNDYFAFKHGLTATFRSIYIDNVYYEVPPLCGGVLYGSLEATQITNVQALLGWESAGANFDIEYGEEGFVQGEGTLLTSTVNSYLLQGLTQGTEYSYYVRSNCGVDGVSEWRGPFNFTTQSVVPSPWFEGFSTTTIPSGWGQNTTSTYSFTATPYNFFITAPASNIVAFKNVYLDSHDLSGLKTLNVGPILPGDKLSFNYKVSMYSTSSNEDGENGPVDPSSGNIDVLISTDFGNTFVSLATLEYGQVGWQTFEQLLTNYVGQIVSVKLVTNWEALDINTGFDNFYIGSCAMPTLPSVTETLMNSATISWTATATDVFEIEYGPLDFVQGTGTVVEVTGSTYTIAGLEASTVYDYYIRRKCTATNNSAWAGKYKFITACDVFMTGFTENFDSTDTGSSSNPTVPLCWTFHDGGDGYGYVNTGSVAPASPTKHFYIYNSDSDLTDPYILISPATDNLGNGAYQVKFKARGSSGAKLKFGRMSNKLNPETFVEINEINLPSSYSATDFIVYLPVTTDDFFAFKFAPSSTYQSLYIDDVVYEPIPACAPPINLNAVKNLSSLTANLTWQGPANVTNNNFEIEWGETGFVQGSADGTIVTSTTLSTTISNLVMGESYSYYVRRICGTENTSWVGPYTFEMDYCSSIPSSNDGTGIGNVTVAGVSMDSLEDVTYEDFTNYDISFNSGELVPASITFNTGYTYHANIWIDFNNNGVFENETELVYVGESSNENPTTLDVSFTVANTGDYITGDYRMRIGTADSGQNVPNSCYSGSYGVTIDLLVNITFPCIQPSNINFVDIGYEYVVLDWEGQGNSNFELEYGITGFVPGTGTTVLSVTKPYTLEGLTPGTTYDFYIRKKCGDIYSDWSAVATTYVFCDTPEPTGDTEQTLVSDELLSDLIINGQDLKFYADPELTIELPASTALQSSGTFFVTQTIDCESDSYLIVDVTVIQRIAMPVVASGQSFCDSGVISDIPVTSLPGATVIWYATETSTTPLAPNTPLVTGDYFVVQTDGITTSHRLLVPVVLNVTPSNLVSQVINLCGTYDFGDLTIDQLPDMTIKWYVSETAISPIPNNVPVETGTYYATQSSGSCESQRIAFQITQNAAMNKPIAGAQNFCGSGTVADLVAQGATGAQILWFASATSLNALSTATALSTGTYYVAQTMNGCTSERRAVAVRVISIAAPVIAPFTVCGGGTISDLYIPVSTETSYKWYLSPSSEFELEQTTALVQGMYFVERVQYGCVSARAAVQVTIGEIPNSPTGVATQSFVEGSTIANLVLNQSNIVWYASFNDSQNSVNPLSLDMPLVNGTTYYAVIIGTNGCPSSPFAVTVDVYLSNDEFDKEGLKYYPNPVDDILNIDYVESIRLVEVFDLLGKRVKTLTVNNQNVQIDLSDLASGAYMIQLKTDSKTQFIKVIKK